MNEELLHYIWKFQRFNHSDLKLTSGESITILRAGTLNANAGPDFFNGQVKIGKTTWVGNIEVHTYSSHWQRHKHHTDDSYDKIILHVVWEDDKPVSYSNGLIIPTIELKGLVHKVVISQYEALSLSSSWVPCESQVSTIPRHIKIQSIDSNLVKRLETKSKRISQLLVMTKNDWEAVLYQLLAKYFGFKTNAVPFELMASSTSFSIVRKYQHDRTLLSALFYGQAGFLTEPYKGNYPQSLQKEYAFLKSKHGLEPLAISTWKFMRMRPANFPTIRIAQFVAVLNKNIRLFQQIIDKPTIEDLFSMFDVQAYKYWDTHYRFDVPASKNTVKKLGDSSIHSLLINVLIPILFTYGEATGDGELKNHSFELLEKIPPEKNTVVRKWKELDMPINSAYDSQALIELKETNCAAKKCLNCAIGNSILQ